MSTTLLLKNIPNAILNAVANGVQNSSAFALPAVATQVEWQTAFGTAPASVTILIQTSVDGVVWTTEATSTNTAGEDGDFLTSAIFIRARCSAVSGGSTTTVYIVPKQVTVDLSVTNDYTVNSPAGSEHDVQLNGGSNTFAAVANGTDGEVLTAHTGAAPTWETPSTGIDELTGDVTAGPGSGSEAATLKTSLKTTTIGITIDGGGSAITTGIKGDLYIPFACTIIAAVLLADQTGDIVIDIWNDSYANYPPTDADSITASAPPTISGGVKSKDSTLTGWDTSVAADSTLRFNVDSVNDIQRVVLQLVVVIS